MQIKIEIRERQNGEYQALCQDIGVSCQGRSLEEVLERIKNLLVFYFSTFDDANVSDDDELELRRQLSFYLKGKNLFLPPDPKVH